MVATPGPGTPSATAPTNATILTATAGYAVPAGVTSLRVDVWAAPGQPGGGNANVAGGPGGLGGYASCVINVNPGQVLVAGFNLDGGAAPHFAYATQYGGTLGGAGGQSVAVYAFDSDFTSRFMWVGGGGGGGGSAPNTSGGIVRQGGTGGPGGVLVAQLSAGTDGTNGGVNAPMSGGGRAVGTVPGVAGGCASYPSSTLNLKNQALPTAGNPPSMTAQGGVGGFNGIFDAVYNGTEYITGSGDGGSGGGGVSCGAGGGGGGTALTDSASGGGGAGGSSLVDPTVTGVKILSGEQSGAPAVMITPNPPGPQTITSPASGSVMDAALALTIDWAGAISAPQAQVAVRRLRVSAAAYEWWTGASWVVTETYIAATTASLAFPSSAFLNGSAFALSLSLIDNTGAVGPYGPSITIQFIQGCVVTITSGPSFATQRPTFTWSIALAPLTPQTSWRVALYSSGFVVPAGQQLYQSTGDVFDSGTVWGEGTILTEMVPKYIPNGSYTALVFVTQAGGQGADQQQAITIAAPVVPPAPAASLYASPATDQPRVAIAVSTAAASVVIGDIQRSIDKGSTWTPVRGAAGAPVGTVTDWEPLPSFANVYRACLQTTDGTARSAWTSVTVTPVARTMPYLSDPAKPGSAVGLMPLPGSLTSTDEDRQALTLALGEAFPGVASDAYGPGSLDLAFIIADEATWASWGALRASQALLLLVVPYVPNRYVRLGPAWKQLLAWVSIVGDASFYASPQVGTPVRSISGKAAIVAPPVAAVPT